MFYQDVLGNFINSYWDLIVWLMGSFLAVSFVLGLRNLVKGLMQLFKREKPYSRRGESWWS